MRLGVAFVLVPAGHPLLLLQRLLLLFSRRVHPLLPLYPYGAVTRHAVVVFGTFKKSTPSHSLSLSLSFSLRISSQPLFLGFVFVVFVVFSEETALIEQEDE